MALQCGMRLHASAPLCFSALVQVHWLRVILDEGHKIGGLAMTNKLQMATALHAERRWVMTGGIVRWEQG